MLGIVAYFITLALLYERVGGFTKEQWIWIVIVTLFGLLNEWAQTDKCK